ITNQNLHGTQDVDNIIVYHSEFKDAVEKLAKHRRDLDGFNVLTVDIDLIFNEFSSGRFDPGAVRNFAKMMYDRSPDFKYLTLFGDGSFDQRQITNKGAKLPIIPLYETDESMHPVEAYPSDDFFALLSENDGGDLIG